MPSIRYMNQTAPFWDFVASFENQGVGQHEEGDDPSFPRRSWHRGPVPHHPHPPHHGGHHGPPGPHGPPPHWHHPGHRGPPPPEGGPDAGHPRPPPPPAPPGYEGSPDTMMGDQEKSGPSPDDKEGECSTGGESGNEGQRGGCRRRGRCGGRGHWAGVNEPHGHGHGHGHRGGPHGGPWGRRGGRHGQGSASWGMAGFPFGGWGGRWMDFLNEATQGSQPADKSGAQDDGFFKPEADVFDTEASYVVHVSVPGAKKEDVAVSWDPEKSEVCISGVLYRPGTEEFLKTLAMDERSVGAFERKLRLGTRANPAQIDVDAITAKLEDGVLVVEVPKLDKDYVEVRKVDIE